MQTLKLEQFCSQLSSLSYLNQPFLTLNKSIASNGHILAMTDHNSDYTPLMSLCSTHDQLNKINESLQKIITAFENSIFIQLPAINLPTSTTCATCQGTGYALLDWCPDCNDEFGCDDECKTCNSHGYLSTLSETKICSMCHGLGKLYPSNPYNDYITIDEMGFDANDIALINHPCTTYAHYDDKSLLFKIDNLNILIMSTDISKLIYKELLGQ